MRGYGQFCPVAKAAELFCERWTALIIRDLAAGGLRFSELRRGVPLMSPTLLAQRLRQLAAEGIIERRPLTSGRGWRYQLTPAGQEFVPLVEALGVWGRRWARRELAAAEIDLGLLLWAMERGVAPAAFGPARTLVRVEFTDQSAAKRFWWFLNQDEACQLCLTDPGFPVDLYLASSLVDMIHLIRGDLPLARALDDGRLEALGDAAARRALKAWLNLGPLAAIAPARPEVAAGL